MSKYNDDHLIIENARKYASDEPVTREQIEKYAAKAREILREKTPEEKAEMERKEKESYEAWLKQLRESTRRNIQRHFADTRKPKKLKFLGIGWWYE